MNEDLIYICEYLNINFIINHSEKEILVNRRILHPDWWHSTKILINMFYTAFNDLDEYDGT